MIARFFWILEGKSDYAQLGSASLYLHKPAYTEAEQTSSSKHKTTMIYMSDRDLFDCRALTVWGCSVWFSLFSLKHIQKHMLRTVNQALAMWVTLLLMIKINRVMRCQIRWKFNHDFNLSPSDAFKLNVVTHQCTFVPAYSSPTSAIHFRMVDDPCTSLIYASPLDIPGKNHVKMFDFNSVTLFGIQR